jgi:hypothetical protein
VFIAGNFAGTLDIGAGPMTSVGGTDIFVGLLDKQAGTVWSRGFGSPDNDQANDVVADGSGGAVVTGSAWSFVDFGGGQLQCGDFNAAFVTRLTAMGDHSWSKCFGDTGGAVGQSVDVDSAGNVVVAGQFFGDVNFGGTHKSSTGGLDIFLAKIDTAATVPWTKVIGGASDDYAGGGRRGEGGHRAPGRGFPEHNQHRR